MGLGRFGGGVGAARFAAEHGAVVTVTDTYPAEKLSESLAALADLDIEYHLGGHIDSDFIENDLIIVNPAVPSEDAYLKKAREHGTELTTEMNLLWQYCPAVKLAVTGSNGKSTTTAMLYHIVKECRPDKKVWLGGNIGKGSLLAKVDNISQDDILVLELSSFQLEDLATLKLSPHVAVVTNISPNHLDRHGTMANYIYAKQNIIRYQGENDFAILCGEDEQLNSWTGIGAGKKEFYKTTTGQTIKLTVPGAHNQLNAEGAIAAAAKIGISREQAQKALESFCGLEHRLELVRELDGVKYYNDSIATTPESVIAAIDAFDCGKILILGGYDKKISFAALAEKVVGNVKAAVLIGQTALQLQNDIEAAGAGLTPDKRPLLARCESFKEAIETCRKMAVPGDAVLLSPACASYGMFINFQQRGNDFRQFVNEL